MIKRRASTQHERNSNSNNENNINNINANEQLNTMPEIIHNKFLNESDIIVNEIIEKIITLVISSNFTNNINKNLPSSCFNFIKFTLDNYFSSNFIFHDIDETYHHSLIIQKVK